MFNDEEFFEALLAEMQEGLCIADSTEHIVAWNAALAELSGVPESEALGRPFAELAERVSWRGKPSVTRSGSALHFADSSSPSVQDAHVTNHEEVGKVPYISWDDIRNFFERLPYMFFVLNEEDAFLYANERARDFFVGEDGALEGRAFREVVNPANAIDELLRRNRFILQSDQPMTCAEVQLIDHGGSPSVLEVNKLPITVTTLADSHMRVLACIAVDLSDLRSAQRELMAEKDQLSAALDGIGDGVAAVDQTGRIVIMNAVLEQLAGVNVKDAVGKPLSQIIPLVHEHTRSPVGDVVSFVQSQAKRGERHNLLLQRGNGEEVMLSQTLAAVTGSDGKVSGAVVVFHDVTAKRRTEEELRKAQKLESVATMARGIAHDFNNFLTAILGSITLLRTATAVDREFYDSLSDAERAVAEAKTLTRQLLVFAEGQTSAHEDASLGELVRHAADFALRGTNVRATYDIVDDLRTVRIDKAQIAQVIQNIVMNARESMTEGGIVSISAKNCERSLPARPDIAKELVAIGITDHGVGIPREYLGRIFDPYFTTKSKSAGLGLSISYSIIRNHDGYVDVQSVLGSGTTVTVYLPASQHAEPRLTDSTTDAPRLFHKRVLVMDDERIVRDVLAKMFAKLGCKCSFAENGVDAVLLYERARASGFPFDMVVLDLTVPGGMGGQETLERLHELDPDALGVLSSGYMNDPVIAEYGRYGFKDTIIKPYSLQDLIRLLERLFPES